MLMHATSHQGCMDTFDSGRKIPCMTTDSNLPFLSDALPAELSYPRPLQTSISINLKMCASVLSMAGAATSIIFVVTKHVFCHDKNMLVATSLLLSRQIRVFVTTKVCLQQQKACCDRSTFVATNICCNKSFVMPKIFVATNVLSQQGQAYFCHNKRHALS